MACNCILGRLRNDVGHNPAGPERWVTKRLVIAFAAKAARVWENSTSIASHSGGLAGYFHPPHPMGCPQGQEAKQGRRYYSYEWRLKQPAVERPHE